MCIDDSHIFSIINKHKTLGEGYNFHREGRVIGRGEFSIQLVQVPVEIVIIYEHINMTILFLENDLRYIYIDDQLYAYMSSLHAYVLLVHFYFRIFYVSKCEERSHGQVSMLTVVLMDHNRSYVFSLLYWLGQSGTSFRLSHVFFFSKCWTLQAYILSFQMCRWAWISTIKA